MLVDDYNQPAKSNSSDILSNIEADILAVTFGLSVSVLNDKSRLFSK
jgi:hypothetical protein